MIVTKIESIIFSGKRNLCWDDVEEYLDRFSGLYLHDLINIKKEDSKPFESKWPHGRRPPLFHKTKISSLFDVVNMELTWLSLL